jgi:hypothetical protein
LFAQNIQLGKAAVGFNISSGGPHYYQKVRDFFSYLNCIMISHFLSSFTWPICQTVDNGMKPWASTFSSGSYLFYHKVSACIIISYLNCILFLFFPALASLCSHGHGQDMYTIAKHVVFIMNQYKVVFIPTNIALEEAFGEVVQWPIRLVSLEDAGNI